MGNDMMDMEELAAYLRRDVREVGKLASRGHLPGHKVGGQWPEAPMTLLLLLGAAATGLAVRRRRRASR